MGVGKRQREDDWLSPASLPSASYQPAGSSSNTFVLDTPAKGSTSAPPTKKQRKKKDPNAPEPEKRGAKTKKQCPKNILERVERVMSQRFYMVDRTRNGVELREQFSVLGSTGNVYTVVIDKTPSCNCPDATKGNHCKHILFIFLKVLQVPATSPHWYQKALLSEELAEIFAHAPMAPNAVAHAHIRDAYARATGKHSTSESAAVSDKKKKRIPTEEDDCPICYESMHGAPAANLVWCEECGNALHKDCFGQWRTTTSAKGEPLTCVFCRAKWAVPAPGGVGPSVTRTSEGYLNIGHVAGLSPVRDTSSYYQGPRRGQHYYGYQDYE